MGSKCAAKSNNFVWKAMSVNKIMFKAGMQTLITFFSIIQFSIILNHIVRRMRDFSFENMSNIFLNRYPGLNYVKGLKGIN